MKTYTNDYYKILEVGGKDHLTWLNGQLSSDIKAMEVNSFHTTSANNPKGKTIALIEILRLENKAYLLLPKEQIDSLYQFWDMYIFTEEVSLTIKEDSCLAFFDEDSIQAIKDSYSLNNLDLDKLNILPEGQIFYMGKFMGNTALIAILPEFPQAKLNDFQKIDQNELEYLRISQGYPFYGKEYKDLEILAPELSMPEIISYTKGCFLGQEVFARIKTYGRTNKFLGILEFPNNIVDKILDKPVSCAGNSRGKITSAVYFNNKTYALGYVPTAKAKLNAEVICEEEKGLIIKL